MHRSKNSLAGSLFTALASFFPWIFSPILLAHLRLVEVTEGVGVLLQLPLLLLIQMIPYLLHLRNRILLILNLLLNAFHNGLDALQIVPLVQDALPDLVHSLTVQAVVVLERHHLVFVLVCRQAILSVNEVELVLEVQVAISYHLGDGLHHQGDVNGVQAA